MDNKITYGIVEDIDDPTCSGRIKVRIDGYMENVPTDQLPWVSFGGSAINSANGGGAISVARVGQKVRVRFDKGEGNASSIEWYAVNELDKDLINEIASDYANTHVLLYDSANDLSIKYQTSTGIVIYYQGSFIQIMPDNTITLHYGKGVSGTQIQLSDGRVDVQGSREINLSTKGTVNIEADNIVLNAKSSIQMKGDASGECAVNGVKLMTLLTMLANHIDMKVPQTAGISSQLVNSMKEGVLNQKIQHI